MSEFVVCDTEISDLDSLKDALIDLGIPAKAIDVHENPVNLNGYKGDKREQKAHVVIRRSNIGRSSNDIGFERGTNGKYKIWVSDYDKRCGLGKKINEELLQTYSKQQILKAARRKAGCKITSMEKGKDGMIRIRMRLH